MRYYLTAEGLEAEVSVSSAAGVGHETVDVVTVSPAGGEAAARRFVLTDDAAHELQSDGSYRRHTLLRGAYDRQKWSFFHSGRVRTVNPVGGVGGRVEGLQSEGAVTAPMNGQVVKVAKQVGDQIESGDIVLILEAMKMENEVTSPVRGVLAELLVEPGQTVGPGQLLFRVEAAD